MRIKKIQETTPLSAQVLNEASDSTKDTYSCNYINGIIESGNNANGNWIKYADGTMICTKYIAGTTNVTTAWGGLYEGSIDAGSFAQEFVSRPIIGATPVGGNGCLIQCFHNTTASVFGTLYITLSVSAADRQYTIDLIAIGRWK